MGKKVQNSSKLTRGFLMQFQGTRCAKDCYYTIQSIRQWGGFCSDLPVTACHVIPDSDCGAWLNKIAGLPGVTLKELNASSLEPGANGYKSRYDRKFREIWLRDMPYGVTLRMDTDTLVLNDPVGMFDNTEALGFTGVLDLWKPRRASLRNEEIDQVNGGVVCFRKDVAARIAQHMEKLIKEGHSTMLYDADQPILNTCLADLGYHNPKHYFPLKWNMPGLKECPVIFHHYSFARQNKELQAALRVMFDQLDRGQRHAYGRLL